jgi:hypothetical protein
MATATHEATMAAASIAGGGVGETLAISIPRTEVAVVRHFQERMPYGLFVPDVDAGAI